MSLSDSPSLPIPKSKSSHTRKRSASDPARLVSGSDTAISNKEDITSFEKTLAVLNDLEKAKAQADTTPTHTAASARKGSGIGGISNGVASLDGVVDDQSDGPLDSENAAGRRCVMTKGNAVKSSAQMLFPSRKPMQSTVRVSKDISKLSPMELKALSDPSVPHVKLATVDPTVTSNNQKPKIIHDSYPLPLLCAISPRIANILASRNITPESSRKASTISTQSTATTLVASSEATSTTKTTTSTSPPNPPPTSGLGLILHTPAPTPLLLLLTYALSASHHGSLTHPHSPTSYPHLCIPLSPCAFFKYGKLITEARNLGFTFLATLLLKRMRKIAREQVHSADVERILRASTSLTTAKPSSSESESESEFWMLELAVTSIATALWEGRLQYKHKYDAICERYPAFDRKVCEAIDALDGQYGYPLV